MNRQSTFLRRFGGWLMVTVFTLFSMMMVLASLTPISSIALSRCDFKSVIILLEPFERSARSSIDEERANHLIWFDPALYRLHPDLTNPETGLKCTWLPASRILAGFALFIPPRKIFEMAFELEVLRSRIFSGGNMNVVLAKTLRLNNAGRTIIDNVYAIDRSFLPLPHSDASVVFHELASGAEPLKLEISTKHRFSLAPSPYAISPLFDPASKSTGSFSNQAVSIDFTDLLGRRWLETCRADSNWKCQIGHGQQGNISYSAENFKTWLEQKCRAELRDKLRGSDSVCAVTVADFYLIDCAQLSDDDLDFFEAALHHLSLSYWEPVRIERLESCTPFDDKRLIGELHELVHRTKLSETFGRALDLASQTDASD